MATPSIVIAGYYGFENLGDEIILAVLVCYLKQAFPRHSLIVLSENPHLTSARYQVESISRWNFAQIHQAIRQSAAFVLGGGGLLQDKTSQKSLWYYLGLMRTAQFCRKPIFLLGQGIGPLNRPFSKRLLSAVLKNTTLIQLRDLESFLEVRALGLDENKLLLGNDLALLSRKLFWDAVELEQANTRKHITIVPRAGLDREVLTSLSANLDTIAQKHDLDIMIVPFFKREDLSIANALAKMMKADVVIATDLARDSSKIWNLLASSELIVGMRLHSLILALAASVPFVGISYDPKMEKFVKNVEKVTQLTLPVWPLKKLNSGQINSDIGEVIKFWNGQKSKLANARDQLVENASLTLTQALDMMRQVIIKSTQ
jgi:polysaccharide pyruvyl transferase CsaB